LGAVGGSPSFARWVSITSDLIVILLSHQPLLILIFYAEV